MEQTAGSREVSAPDPGARLLSSLLLVLLLAPAATLAYLPMTDLPQHLAATSILWNLDDPRFGFAAFYEPAWNRSLYALPYLLAMSFAPFASLEAGMRVVVVLALASLPIGVFALLRALGKPGWLALLALPLVYNRAFFWGFVNFQLALGLALLALAILVRPRRGWGSELALSGICVLIAFTHPYGLLMLAGYVLLWLLFGERRALGRHALALAPMMLGMLAWGLSAGIAQGAPSSFAFEPILERLDDFEESVLGGYRDGSEAHLLLAFLGAWAVLAAPVFPVSRARWRALSHHERVLWAFAGVNLLLFAIVPAGSSLGSEIHVRHAVIAMAVLPALAAQSGSRQRARRATAALAILALVTIANAWVHLVRFDREAKGFDAVVERIPFGARLVALTWDANGAVMRTKPYWHFGAYAQARRGGLLAQSFPRMFWNIPVRMRANVQVPDTPESLEARPYLFDYRTFGFAYDHVLVRMGETKGRDRFPEFPYQLVFEAPLWQIWRALPGRAAPPSAAVPRRASPSAPEPTSTRVGDPNLVLLSIDTLRADSLGSYGHSENPTPNLDRLAREGVRFASAYSTSSWTAPSMASLMTGLYPRRHGVRHGFVERDAVKGQEELPPDLPVLTELLHARGYRTFGIVANGHLDARFGFARGFDRYECLGFENGPLVLEHLQTWLEEITEDREAPYFLWVHLLDPHSPYLGFPPYVERIWGSRPRHPDLENLTPADEYDGKKLSGDRLEYVKMLYASEVSYADFLVGEILGQLGVRNAPRQPSDRGTFIVALSDHGEELSEHGRFGHGHTLFEESVHVPLIMRWPDGSFANTRVSVPVSLVDIVPTLAAALDLSDPSHTVASDGESLLPLVSRAAGSTSRTLFAELSRGQQRVMARMGDLKLIRDPLESRSTLFDLARDPLEQRDLARTRSAETAALEARIARALDAQPAREAAVKPLDEHGMRALKAMGYVQ